MQATRYKFVSKAVLFLVSGLLVSCASKPAPVVDNTPLLRAAQVTTSYSSTGFKGYLASEGTQDSYTFPNMRRTNRTSKFSGSIMSKISGAASRSDIVRIDKGLEWELDNKKKEYYECGFGGCGGIGTIKESMFQAESEGEFEEEEDLPPGCVITVTEQKFEVSRTGQSREVNGFPAEEYLIDWRYNARDDEGGKLENLFTINIWTTKQTPEMTEALSVQDQFEVNYRQALSGEYPDVVTKAIPRDALAMLERFFLDSLSDEDLAKLKGLMANNVAIEGFPVSTKTKWDARNNTCAVPEEPEQAEEKDVINTSSVKGLLGSISKQIVKQEVDKKKAEKAREFELAPIFVYIQEVTSVKMADIRESQFNAPVGYKLLTRR